MIDYNNFNNESLLYMKPKYFNYVYILLIIFGGVIIWSNYIYVNDIYYGKAYIECDNTCNIKMTLSIEDANSLDNINYLIIKNIKIDNFDYEFSEIKYDQDNNVNYQILNIRIDKINLNNKMIQDIKIYYKEDTLFNKVKEVFLN